MAEDDGNAMNVPQLAGDMGVGADVPDIPLNNQVEYIGAGMPQNDPVEPQNEYNLNQVAERPN